MSTSACFHDLLHCIGSVSWQVRVKVVLHQYALMGGSCNIVKTGQRLHVYHRCFGLTEVKALIC